MRFDDIARRAKAPSTWTGTGPMLNTRRRGS